MVDRGAGARIEPQGPEGDVFRYEIPDDGVLRVRDAEPIGSWHTTTAEYRGGAPLPVQTLGPIPPFTEDVKLRSISADSQGNYYFLVGTDAELDHASRSPELPLGKVTRNSP